LGKSAGEIPLSTFSRKWSLVDIIPFDTGHGSGSILATWNVTPAIFRIDASDDTIQPAACAVPSLFHAYWKGGMEYKLQVILPSIMAGRLVVLYEPLSATHPGVEEPALMEGFNEHILMDCATDDVHQFRINYAVAEAGLHTIPKTAVSGATAFCNPPNMVHLDDTMLTHLESAWMSPLEGQTTHHNGRVELRVLAPLVTASGGALNARILLYARAADDMRYWGFNGSLPKGLYPNLPVTVSSGVSSLATQDQPTTVCVQTHTSASDCWVGQVNVPLLGDNCQLGDDSFINGDATNMAGAVPIIGPDGQIYYQTTSGEIMSCERVTFAPNSVQTMAPSSNIPSTNAPSQFGQTPQPSQVIQTQQPSAPSVRPSVFSSWWSGAPTVLSGSSANENGNTNENTNINAEGPDIDFDNDNDQPTDPPTEPPTYGPSRRPTPAPSTESPTKKPSTKPTFPPSDKPSQKPVPDPTKDPTPQPQPDPTNKPVKEPTGKGKGKSSGILGDIMFAPEKFTSQPSDSEMPSTFTGAPSEATLRPSIRTNAPSATPTRKPTKLPSASPTAPPSEAPITGAPSTEKPSKEPTALPTGFPTALPTADCATAIAMDARYPKIGTALIDDVTGAPLRVFFTGASQSPVAVYLCGHNLDNTFSTTADERTGSHNAASVKVWYYHREVIDTRGIDA